MLKKLNTPTVKKLATIVVTTVAFHVACNLIAKKLDNNDN